MKGANASFLWRRQLMIEFENLPSTNTPLSAENLNNMQTVQAATVITSSSILQNTNYTIPLFYRVGDNSLEVYYMGEKLIKGTHYVEVGTAGAISNIIQFYNWGQAVPANRTIEFVVRGVYANEA